MEKSEAHKSIQNLLYLCKRDNWVYGHDVFIGCKSDDKIIVNSPSSKSEIIETLLCNLESTNSYLLSNPLFLIHYFVLSNSSKFQWSMIVNSMYCKMASLSECGLLPIGQEGMLIGARDIQVYEFKEFITKLVEFAECDTIKFGEFEKFIDSERKKIHSALDKNNKVLIKGCGVLICGETVPQVWFDAFQVVCACETQVKLGMSSFEDGQIIWPSDKAQKSVRQFDLAGTSKVVLVNRQNYSSGVEWAKGELEYEAVMRQLEDEGIDTGYKFKQKQIWKENSKDNN